MTNAKHIIRIEAIGALGIVLLGSAMHFTFDLFGQWRPLAIFAAVNESIWEHLKLAFWPGLALAFTMTTSPEMTRRDVLSAKGISLAFTAAMIVGVFTAYTAILGRNLLVLDIGTFIVSVFVGQGISAFLLASQSTRFTIIGGLGVLLLMGQVVVFSTLTFFPPDHWLFIEAHTGFMGIPTSE